MHGMMDEIRARAVRIAQQRAAENARMEFIFWGMFLACTVIVLGMLMLIWRLSL